MNNAKVNLTNSTKDQTLILNSGDKQQINNPREENYVLEKLVEQMNFWGVGSQQDELSFLLTDLFSY